ncbi:hypothetical protein FIV41_08440 [Pseudomonas marginalis]|uniref:ShKT domain-containing protein n=1 Tax=Pseudomonas marginalis TaxID=298 RepID=A0A9X9BUY1_PSEMA|nr:hypothetical protein [Pseudomonas sp. JV449]TKJ82483.1 hypothetical protein PspCFBP13509_02405 [Pseudomonas sp. CFBP13509]TWR61219.1 hypothetical protein FIV41_08440 [Pseudomonas marginalis]
MCRSFRTNSRPHCLSWSASGRCRSSGADPVMRESCPRCWKGRRSRCSYCSSTPANRPSRSTAGWCRCWSWCNR